jgi:phospholipase/carboxylesterase
VGLRHNQPLCGIIALSCYLPLRQRVAAETNAANRKTPILMCHGREDVVVLPAFGEQSRDAMREAGLDVEWHIYSMAHSLCHPEVFDISAWLQYRLALVPET